MREQLVQLINACSELMGLMEEGDEQAVDTARGLLWRWVDEGNSTELINLLGAIKLLAQTTLDHLVDTDTGDD